MATKTVTKQTISIAISYDAFEKIAKSKKAEFQIGTLEYKLTEIHIKAFREFLNHKIEE